MRSRTTTRPGRSPTTCTATRALGSGYVGGMAPYIRTVKTALGARAVQIVYSNRKGARDIEHIGSAHDEVELELLKMVARQKRAAGQDERLRVYSAEGWREQLAAACAKQVNLGPSTLVLARPT